MQLLVERGRSAVASVNKENSCSRFSVCVLRSRFEGGSTSSTKVCVLLQNLLCEAAFVSTEVSVLLFSVEIS